MLLFFSRPPEFWGVPAFFIILTGFATLLVVSGALLPLSFVFKDDTVSRSKAVKSWLVGFAALGAFFLIVNLILAIPILLVLFVVEGSVFKGDYQLSDESFHKIDNFITFAGIVVNLICYFGAVKTLHGKIYKRFFK